MYDFPPASSDEEVSYVLLLSFATSSDVAGSTDTVFLNDAAGSVSIDIADAISDVLPDIAAIGIDMAQNPMHISVIIRIFFMLLRQSFDNLACMSDKIAERPTIE